MLVLRMQRPVTETTAVGWISSTIRKPPALASLIGERSARRRHHVATDTIGSGMRASPSDP